MADSIVDTLTTRFVGDATSYNKAVKEVENANDRFVSSSDKLSGKMKDLGGSFKGVADSAQSALERFGAADEFKELNKDLAESSTGLQKLAEDFKRWTHTDTFLKGFSDLRNMFTSMYDALKQVASTDLSDAFSTAWTTVSGVVTKSFGAIKTAALAAWAAMASSPAIAIVAAGAVVAGLLVAVRALYDYQWKAKKLKEEFEQAEEDRAEKRSGMIQWANERVNDLRQLGPTQQNEGIRKELIDLGDVWEKQNDKLEAATEANKERTKSFWGAVGGSFKNLGLEIANTYQGVIAGADWGDIQQKQKEARAKHTSLDDYMGTTEKSKRMQENVKAAQEELDTINATIEVFRERLTKSGKEALQAIRSSRQEVVSSVETLGMSPTELRIRAGEESVRKAQEAFTAVSFAPETDDNFVENIIATEEALKTLKETQKELVELRFDVTIADQAKAAYDLKQRVKGVTEGLEGQIVALQMTNSELEIWKLQQQALKAGTYIDDKELQRIKGLQEAKDAAQELARLKEKGKQLDSTHASPEDKYRTEVEELNEMLEEGYIKQTTYNKALEEAGKRFDDAGKDAKHATDEILKYDHALAGSQEAADRLAKQQELFDTQGRSKRARPAVEDRLWLQQTVDLAENPLTKAQGEKNYEMLQYDILVKIHDSLENPDPYDKLATVVELTGVDLGI